MAREQRSYQVNRRQFLAILKRLTQQSKVVTANGVWLGTANIGEVGGNDAK